MVRVAEAFQKCFLDWICVVTTAERMIKKWKSWYEAHSQLLVFPSVISLSPDTFLLLSFLPTLSASHSSFQYTVQGSEVDIWVLHRATWAWETAGHTSHTSFTHTLWSEPRKGALSMAAGLTTHNSIRIEVRGKWKYSEKWQPKWAKRKEERMYFSNSRKSRESRSSVRESFFLPF